MSAAEKTERIMGALMDHLRAKYQLLSSSNVFRLQTNAAGTLTLILDLLSPKVDGGDSDATKFGGDINDIQFLRDVNCGLQYLPTFQIVFTPMAIVSDQDSPPPSSRTLFNVLLVNYQGSVLKKDFMTFYVNFPPEVIAATQEAAAVAEEGITVEPDVDLAEKTSSNCDLLEKLDRYREFRLCCGVRKNRKSQQLKLAQVFIEPFGETRDGFVVRSRECRFMLELEIVEGANIPPETREPSTVPDNCRCCKVMENKLAELGVDKLKSLSRVKVEVKDENSGATIVLPIDQNTEGQDQENLLAVVDVGEDGQPTMTQAVTLDDIIVAGQDQVQGMDDTEDDFGDEDDDFADNTEEGKENRDGKMISVVRTGTGKNATFNCEMCDKKFKYIDAYWKHVKRCGQPKGVELTPRQASMMVTRKSKADKHTCANCGRDFFHEVNWKKHEEMCKAGRVKSRAIYKQQVGQASTTPKPVKKEKAKKVKKDSNSKEKAPKEIRECLICLKKVGTQWERHMRLHKERVGDKLTEETECPSWDCDLKFNDRIELNRHFLENHDAEAIPCVYCVRLLQRDRIRQHIRNEHPHMSHLCTECGRECIYPSALKQHIKEFHQGIRDAMCDLCGKSYPNQRSLRKHIKTHAVQREHICPECGKDFLTSTKLNEHRRVHTGAKPFQCKVCAYKAGKKENVQAHIKKVHNVATNINEHVLIIKEEL